MYLSFTKTLSFSVDSNRKRKLSVSICDFDARVPKVITDIFYLGLIELIKHHAHNSHVLNPNYKGIL